MHLGDKIGERDIKQGPPRIFYRNLVEFFITSWTQNFCLEKHHMEIPWISLRVKLWLKLVKVSESIKHLQRSDEWHEPVENRIIEQTWAGEDSSCFDSSSSSSCSSRSSSSALISISNSSPRVELSINESSFFFGTTSFFSSAGFTWKLFCSIRKLFNLKTNCDPLINKQKWMKINYDE